MMDCYRHTLGGGKIFGNEADVSPDTFLDEKSTVEGESLVHSSTFIESNVRDAFICEAKLSESIAGHSKVVASTLLESLIRDSTLTRAWASGCVLLDTIARGVGSKSPVLRGVEMRGVIVEGDVYLRGPWRLDGRARIHRGVWDRAPRFKELQTENGIRVGLTECTSGRAHIACRCHRISDWLKAGPRLGRMLGWADEYVAFAAKTFEEWMDVRV